MSVPIISENCYTCQNSVVTKQICNFKNTPIGNMNLDKCEHYVQRQMIQCAICGEYLIELASHVKQKHQKTMREYNIIARDIVSHETKVRRKNLWD